MKKIIIVIISLFMILLLLSACGEPETISCYDGADRVTESYPTKPLSFEGGSGECITLRSFHYYDDIPSLNVTEIGSVSELENFIKKHAVYWNGQEMLIIERFKEYSRKCDESFFEDKVLIVGYIKAHSGSCQYEVSELKKEGSDFIIFVEDTYGGDVYTWDMAAWHVAVEYERDDIEDVTQFYVRKDTK